MVVGKRIGCRNGFSAPVTATALALGILKPLFYLAVTFLITYTGP
jgi:hypothetical protein